jgi:hypothetical protein
MMTPQEKALLIDILDQINGAIQELEAESETCWVREGIGMCITELKTLFAVNQTKE